METIQFIGVTPEQLQRQISKGVQQQLTELLKLYTPSQPNEYLTRKDVAKMFSVDLSTLHNWNKSGKLKP